MARVCSGMDAPAYQGMTPSSFWNEPVGPPSGNVARRIGVNPHDTLSPAMISRLAQAMREFETGRRAY